MRKHILVLLILFYAGAGIAQKSKCDRQAIKELGAQFRDTIAPPEMSHEDPNDPLYGEFYPTRSMAMQALRDDYFDDCLKGKRRRFFERLLGKGDFRKEGHLIYGNCFSALGYSDQSYDENGLPKDPMPGDISVCFDKRNRAIDISYIVY